MCCRHLHLYFDIGRRRRSLCIDRSRHRPRRRHHRYGHLRGRRFLQSSLCICHGG